MQIPVSQTDTEQRRITGHLKCTNMDSESIPEQTFFFCA